MADKTKITIGALLVVILVASGVIYITYSDVRIRVDNDRSTFYVIENGRWVVSGREYNRMFDGSGIMYRDARNVRTDHFQGDMNFTIVRTTPYQRGPVIRDTWFFRGDISDKENFPVYHTVEIYNGSGYFYRYSVDELVGTGPKRRLNGETELSFGRSMKVEFKPGYRWAWVGWPYGSDSFAVQYDIPSDYEIFHIRFFDPVWNPDESTNPRTLSEGFEEDTSLNDSIWINFTTPNGRIAIITGGSPAPHSGSKHLRMDSNNQNARKAIITNFNMSGTTYVNVSFWLTESSLGDEDDECPSSWTGYDPGANQGDCVAFTCDNNTFYKLVDLAPGPTSYTFFNTRVDDHANWCGTANESFRIWFGHDDNNVNPFDGFFYDDINITFDQTGAFAPPKLTLDGIEGTRYYELGAIAHLNATMGCATCEICLSIDTVPEYQNVSCSNGSVAYNFTTVSKEWRFNDTTLEKNFTSNETEYVKLKSGIDMINFTINVTGVDESGLPEEVRIITNGTTIFQLVGEINGTRGDVFNLSDNSDNVIFVLAGTSVKSIEMSKNTTVTGATLNLTGIDSNVTVGTFNDSSTVTIMTFSTDSGGNDTVYIDVAKDTTIVNATFVIEGQGFENMSDNFNDGSLNATKWGSEGAEANDVMTAVINRSDGGTEPKKILVSKGKLFTESNYTVIRRFLEINESVSNNWQNVICISVANVSWDDGLGTPPIYGFIPDNVAFCKDKETIVNAFHGHIYVETIENISLNASVGNLTKQWGIIELNRTSTDVIVTIDGTHERNISLSVWVGDFYFNFFEVYATHSAGEVIVNTTIDYIGRFPESISVDTGDDGIIDFQNTTHFESSELIDLNITAVQEYIDDECISTTCPVPFRVRSTALGKAKIGNVSITYSSTTENVTLDVGSDGTNDFTQSGPFTTSEFTNLNITAIQNYIDSTSCDGVTCNVPMSFTSAKAGTVNITDITVNYTFNPISLNATLYKLLLNTSLNHTNVSLGINASKFGNVSVNGIEVNYNGSQKYNVTAKWAGNATFNASSANHFLHVVWSNFSKVLPYTYTTYVNFVPQTNSSKNVTPWFQSFTIPIFNITSFSKGDYDGNPRNFTTYAKLNETFTGMNVTISNTSNKTDGFLLLNGSFQFIYTNISLGQSFGNWLFADFENINTTLFRKFRFRVRHQTCCDLCVCDL